MTTALNTKLESLLLEDNPPITVDWSTTIQSLSTDLHGYDLTLELTANSESLKDFFNNGGVFKAEKPLSNIEHFIAWGRPDSFARGVTLLIDILAGQTTLDKAADLVRGLGETHKQKANYLKKGKRKTYHDRIIPKNRLSQHDTRHSFSVGDVHQLAQSLRAL